MKEYKYDRDYTIGWLESNQMTGAFDGFPEEKLDFSQMKDVELTYYWEEWIDEDSKREYYADY